MGFVVSIAKQLQVFVIRYERYFSAVALLLGFAFDNLTLRRIDLLYENLVLLAYLLAACLGIAGVHLLKSGCLHALWLEKAASISPFLIQFAFGGLFSGFFVFYSRSGEFAASWIFIMIIFVLLIGNEFFRRRYYELPFQVSVFYLALFSYLIFFVPIITGSMGAPMFLVSGSLSLLFASGFLFVLLRIFPAYAAQAVKPVAISIGSIFFLR